jgi:phosphopantetheinyl transferase
LPSLRLPAALPGGCVWLLDLRLEPDVDAWRAGEHGKPHCVNAQHGHFNLSHSED